MANNAFIRQDDLNSYSAILRQWTTDKITAATNAIGTVFTLCGTVATTNDLPTEGVSVGDVYLVGAEGASSFDEYYYTANGTYELMGTTAVSIEGLVSGDDLWGGADGTGTAEAPAADSILGKLITPISTRVTAIETSLALQITEDEMKAMFTDEPATPSED